MQGSLNVGEVEYVLRECDGNMAAAARIFGVTRQAVRQFCLAHPELGAICQEARESLKDDAENELSKLIRAGDLQAIKYFLGSQAKDRGYGNDPAPQQTVNVNVDARKRERLPIDEFERLPLAEMLQYLRGEIALRPPNP